MVRLLRSGEGWLPELQIRNIATMLGRCARDWRELWTQSVSILTGITSLHSVAEASSLIGCRFSKKRRRLGDIRRIEILVINFVGSGGRIRTADTRIMIPVARPETANFFGAMSRLCRKQCPLGGRKLRPVILRREQPRLSLLRRK